MATRAPRDLIAELEASLTAQPTAKAARASARDEMFDPHEREDMLALAGAPHFNMTQSVNITVADETCGAALALKSKNRDAAVRALTVVPGSYWLVSTAVNGYPCWRQEPSTAANSTDFNTCG